jgi:hypothetical protein
MTDHNPAGDATAHTYSSYPLPAKTTASGEIVDGSHTSTP